MPRILFALTSHFKDESGWESGCYVLEVAVPYYHFVKNNFEIDFISPNGGAVPVKQLDLEEPKVKSFLQDKEAHKKFYESKQATEINADDYDVIYFPGGHGVMYDLPFDKDIADVAGKIYDKGGFVCAVCHGGAGLLNIKKADGSYLIAGKKLTAFSNKEEESIGTDKKLPFLLETALIEKGAIYSSVANWQEYVVVDERLITGQNPASDLLMAKTVVKALKKK